MGLRCGPLRAYLMSNYSLGKLNCLLELQLHASRSNVCRLSSTSRGDTQRQIKQPTGSKPSGSSTKQLERA